MFKYFKGGVTVLCVLDRRRVKLSGLYPVKVEVVFRRRQKLFSSGVDMSEEEWKSFFSMHDITFKQQKLRKRFDSIVECVDNLCFSENFSIESLVDMLGGKAEITLNRYMESVSETFLAAGKVNSYYRCRSTLRNIEKFAGKSVFFSDIDVGWLRACERFWLTDGKNCTTVCIYMKTLKSIMNRALDDGYLNGSLPYGRRGYLIPQGSARKMALTKDQIKRLMDFTGDSKLEKYRDLWLFSYLCNGINFKDMLLLRHRNVENGEICFIRSKTESAYRISKVVRAVVTMCNKAIVVMKKIFRMVMQLSLACGIVAFTGCTDYEEDINALNSRLDALETGKIASVEEQIAALGKTLESVQTVVDALEGLDLESVIGKVDGLESEIESLKKKVDGIDLSKYAEKSYVDATFATKDAVAEINKSLGAISGKITALENKWANEEGVENIKDVLSKISDVKTTADKAAADATTALGEVASLKEALKSYYTKSEVDALMDAKLDASAFEAEFDSALEAALAEGGVITSAIESALNNAVSELKGRIDALMNKVDDLAKRIQSLVFVPEYTDGCATAELYCIDHFQLSETQTVFATFQVTPKELAAQVAAQKENVFVYVVPVKTRAAAEAVVVSGDALKLSANPETGRVEVEAQVDANITDFAIALYVADPKVVDEPEQNADIEDIDAGTYISSSYVQVKYDEDASELSDNYVLYNFDTKKEYPAEYLYKAEWNNAPAEYTFYEGYEIAVQLDGKYYTLADAAEKLNLTVEALTPKYSYTTSEPESPAQARAIVVKKAEKFGVTAMMTVEKPYEFVGTSLEVENLFSYYVTDKDVPVSLIKNTTTYEIVNKQLEINLAAQSLDWSYNTACELSSAKTAAAAYDKPIIFKEVEVLDKPEGYNVFDLLDEPVSREVYLNGEKLADVSSSFNLEAVASQVAHIAKVTVTNYEFSNKSANVYKMINKYKMESVPGDPESVTEVTVTFEFTLGQMSAAQNIDLGSYEIPFMTVGNYKEVSVDGVEEKAFAGVKTYFENADEFTEAFFLNNVIEKTTKKNGAAINPKYTYLGIAEKDKSIVRVSAADLSAFEDKFDFETLVSTWYGVDYTFTAKAAVVAPEYALAPSPEYTTSDYVAKINGEIISDKYVIKTVDLSKYIKVINLDSGVKKNDIKVKYEVVTKEDAKAGIINVPVPSAETVGVEIATGKIETSNIEWLGNYTARELKVKAILLLGDIKVDEQVLTLTTERPITKFESAAISATRKPGSKATEAKLWSKMTLNAIANTANLVKNTAADFSKIFENSKADQIYNAAIVFGDKVTVKVDGKVDPLYPTTKYSYDKTTATITFIGDDADLIKPVEFEVEATLTYVLDYNNVQAITIPVKVTFSQKK